MKLEKLPDNYNEEIKLRCNDFMKALDLFLFGHEEIKCVLLKNNEDHHVVVVTVFIPIGRMEITIDDHDVGLWLYNRDFGEMLSQTVRAYQEMLLSVALSVIEKDKKHHKGNKTSH